MNDVDIKTPAPIVTGDMNIHLAYIRRDLDELKTIQKSQHAENIAALVDLKNASPSREEFSSLKEEVADHETRMRKAEWMLYVGVGGLYVINAIIGFYLIYKSK